MLRWLSIAAALAAVGCVVVPELWPYLDLEALQARRRALEAYRFEQPLLSSAAYLAVSVLCIALGLPVTAILSLAAGAMFGLVWGTLLATAAGVGGATLSFVVARHLLREPVLRRHGARLAEVDAAVRRDGAFYLFSLRLTPLIPFAVTNVLMALTPMRTLTFVWVSAVGMVAIKAVLVNAGTRLGQIEGVRDALSWPTVVAFALLGLLPLLARHAQRQFASRRRR